MIRSDHVHQLLLRLGGVATWAELTEACGARAVRRAVADGQIVRSRRGRYTTQDATEHRAEAHRMSATLSHLSAAIQHGWKVKELPDRPQVTVARTRRLRDPADRRVRAHWRDLEPGQVRNGVTTPLQTALDCARDLPFDAGLAVADSALRNGDIDLADLRRLTARLRGPGSGKARLVSRHTTPLAANPFESVLRSISLEVPGLPLLTPQLRVMEHGLWAMVDLGHQRLRLVVEGDSFSIHGGRREFRRDCRRYDELVAWGWAIFRFTWEDAMLQPDFVKWCLSSWLATREGKGLTPPPPRLAHLA